MSKSKRELREQRRAAEQAAAVAAESPPPPASATAARRRRPRRVLVAVGIAISAAGGARPSPSPQSSAAKLVAGIQEHNGVLGDPKAPITVTEYLDPQCPICAEASKANLPDLINNYVRTGKVKLQARTLQLHRPGLGHRRQGRRRAPSSRASCGRSWRPSTPRRARRTPATSPTASSLTSPRPPASTPSKAMAFADGARRAGRARPGRRGRAGAEDRLDPELHRRPRATASREVVAVGLDDLTRQARQGALLMTRAAAIVVAVIGLGIATYLTIVHYAGGAPVCAIAHGCETVQKSDYAKLAGVPVALLGAARLRRHPRGADPRRRDAPARSRRSSRSSASASAPG